MNVLKFLVFSKSVSSEKVKQYELDIKNQHFRMIMIQHKKQGTCAITLRQEDMPITTMPLPHYTTQQ